MKALTLLAIALLVAVTGCKQDPFPTNGVILLEKPKEKAPILPPLVLDIPDSIEFREGEANEVAFKAKVPDPATPIVTVQDLPEGATFDSAAMKLLWTPDFAAGNEPNDPTARFRSYVVVFTLRSSLDSVTSVTRRALVTVRDVPRAIDIGVPAGDRELTEGKEFVETVTIKSEDYPDGPFNLNLTNLPQAAKVEPVTGDPKSWTIKYTPDLRAVTVEDNWSGSGHYKFLDVKYTVVLPNGTAVSKLSKWKLVDTRQFAAISAPKNVVQGTDINFTLVAEDVNGETLSVSGSTHPIISLANGPFGSTATDPVDAATASGSPDFEIWPSTGFPNPDDLASRYNGFFPGSFAPETEEVSQPAGTPFGRLTITTEKNDITKGNVNPVTIAAVRWNQIPADKVGTSHTLHFRICVNRYRWSKDHCTNQDVAVKFDVEQKPAPQIDRAEWPLAQLRYVRQNDTFTSTLRVADGEVGGGTPSVQIFPEAMRDEVKWANHKLVITPKTAGIRQFNVVATSTFGVVQAESFLYETLPWSWSKVLVLGESPNEPEMKKTLELYDDAAMANPAIQPLDEKLLALRTTLVIGTKSLSERSLLPELEKAAAKIPNVILLSPLLGALEGTLKTEIAELKLTLDKRFLDIPSLPALKTFEVRLDPNSQLTIPSNSIRLSEKASAESKSPLTLKIEAGSNCKPRLNLTHAQVPAPLLAAASCQRANGGVLVLSGFEWADLETSLPDAKIAKKWMSEVEKP
jgi:hypothetical protein